MCKSSVLQPACHGIDPNVSHNINIKYYSLYFSLSVCLQSIKYLIVCRSITNVEKHGVKLYLHDRYKQPVPKGKLKMMKFVQKERKWKVMLFIYFFFYTYSHIFINFVTVALKVFVFYHFWQVVFRFSSPLKGY